VRPAYIKAVLITKIVMLSTMSFAHWPSPSTVPNWVSMSTIRSAKVDPAAIVGHSLASVARFGPPAR
jgi:hypothetical protein